MAETREVIRLMRNALLAAAKVFEQYANYHEAKQPPDREKAEANRDWAERCRDVAQTGEHHLRLPITEMKEHADATAKL
jgi:hypothetical protein